MSATYGEIPPPFTGEVPLKGAEGAAMLVLRRIIYRRARTPSERCAPTSPVNGGGRQPLARVE